MAHLLEYRCRRCGYKIWTSPSGRNAFMSGEFMKRQCSICHEIVSKEIIHDGEVIEIEFYDKEILEKDFVYTEGVGMMQISEQCDKTVTTIDKDSTILGGLVFEQSDSTVTTEERDLQRKKEYETCPHCHNTGCLSDWNPETCFCPKCGGKMVHRFWYGEMMAD